MNEYKCNLVRIIDGDTVVLDVDLGFHIRHTITLRLEGIDTPEKGEQGFIEANEALKSRLNGELVVKTNKQGSFGRWVGVLYCNGVSINETMLRDKFAKLYK